MLTMTMWGRIALITFMLEGPTHASRPSSEQTNLGAICHPNNITPVQESLNRALMTFQAQDSIHYDMYMLGCEICILARHPRKDASAPATPILYEHLVTLGTLVQLP
jgi:hypothetical protein